MLKRINPVLPELILELVLYGLVIQFTGVWFVEDRLRYSTGLWFGIVVAGLMAVNMAVVILDTVELASEKGASRKSALFSAIRYIGVVVAFAVTGIFDLGNLITMFIGVMGLKVAAYLQPFTHKFITKYARRKENCLRTKSGSD